MFRPMHTVQSLQLVSHGSVNLAMQDALLNCADSQTAKVSQYRQGGLHRRKTCIQE
jgi:hypothetical protein